MFDDEQISSLVARADLYQNRGDSSALFDVANEVLRNWPEKAYGYQVLAASHSLREDYKSAIDAIREAVAVDPEDAYSLYRLGFYLRCNEEWVAAESAIRSSLEQDPEDAWSWIELSRICLGTLDKDGADRYARHALSLDPENVTARQELASALTARNEHEDALQVLTDALAINPEDADVWNDRAQSLLALKRVPEAEESAREALRMHPENKYHQSTLYRCIRARSWVRRALLWPGTAVAWMWNAVEYQAPRDKDNTPRALLFLATLVPIIALGVLWVTCCCSLLVLYELFTGPYVRRKAQGRGAVSDLLYVLGALLLAGASLYAIYWALGSWASWKNVALTFAGAFALVMIWGEWDEARNAKRAKRREQWAGPLGGGETVASEEAKEGGPS